MVYRAQVVDLLIMIFTSARAKQGYEKVVIGNMFRCSVNCCVSAFERQNPTG